MSPRPIHPRFSDPRIWRGEGLRCEVRRFNGKARCILQHEHQGYHVGSNGAAWAPR